MELYDELAAYVERPLDLVRLRGQYAAYELAWQWGKRKGDYAHFYAESDLYLFDLTEYQTRLHAAGWHDWLTHIIQTRNIQRVLDFGGGIGESTITAFKAGVWEIDFVEVIGSPQKAYAEQRFLRRGMKVHSFNERWKPVGPYDLIIAMDVLEHMETPVEPIKRFHDIAPLLVTNCDDLPYGPLFPQHISHPDQFIGDYYSKVEGNLWEKL